MRIGIDTFGCDHRRSGSGSYLFSLIANLPETEHNEIELFGLEIDRFVYDSTKGTFIFSGINIPDSLFAARIWHQFFLKSFIKKRGYDVVLYPAAMTIFPLTNVKPGVIVINELFSGILKNTHGFFALNRLKKCLKNAEKIIAASHCIKKELIAFGVNAEKIEVVYNGVDHSIFMPKPVANEDLVLIKPFAIKRPFFIYPSRIQHPEKKHVELIKAFTLFKQRTALPHKLVLAGDEGQNALVVQKAVLDSPYASDIVMTGYFPHQNLPDLYACSDACLMPSVAEGFGMPVIEAMACGIPVVCSKAGALSEIGGKGAIYVDPDNAEEFAGALEDIVKKTELKAEMIEENKNWVSRFTWQNTVERTTEVLKNSVRKEEYI